MKFIIKKIREWSWRYLPSEIACSITSIILATIIFNFTENPILTAFVGALSEAFVYYAVIAYRELKKLKTKRNFKNYLLIIRNLLIEFGFSESLDSFIIRPFFMYWMPIIVGNLSLGIFIGKLISDFIFYVPTIIMYEIRKHYFDKKRINNKKNKV